MFDERGLQKSEDVLSMIGQEVVRKKMLKDKLQKIFDSKGLCDALDNIKIEDLSIKESQCSDINL